MRVLLLVLRGSEFDSGFPPSLWTGGNSILSLQLHAGDTLWVEGLGFNLGNTTYSQYSFFEVRCYSNNVGNQKTT